MQGFVWQRGARLCDVRQCKAMNKMNKMNEDEIKRGTK